MEKFMSWLIENYYDKLITTQNFAKADEFREKARECGIIITRTRGQTSSWSELPPPWNLAKHRQKTFSEGLQPIDCMLIARDGHTY